MVVAIVYHCSFRGALSCFIFLKNKIMELGFYLIFFEALSRILKIVCKKVNVSQATLPIFCKVCQWKVRPFHCKQVYGFRKVMDFWLFFRNLLTFLRN